MSGALSKLSFIKLPYELVYLCRLNMSGNRYKDSLEELILKNKMLSFLLESTLKDLDDGRGLEKIIMGLGWNNFRERLTSIYAGKLFYGHFPQSFQLDLIEDIKDFENQFQNYGIAGFSRVYLLGLYIKFQNIHRLSQYHDDEDLQFEINANVIQLLNISKIKVEKIDYLILFLHQILEIIELDEARKLITSKLTFNQIYEGLKKDERKIIHDNLLAYSSSIFEDDFFLYQKV